MRSSGSDVPGWLGVALPADEGGHAKSELLCEAFDPGDMDWSRMTGWCKTFIFQLYIYI